VGNVHLQNNPLQALNGFLEEASDQSSERHRFSVLFTLPMDDRLDAEKLLNRQSESSGENDLKDVEQYLSDKTHDSRKIRQYKLIGVVLISILILSNAGWAWRVHRTPQHKPPKGPADLTYFLEEGDAEKIYVPFEHDWEGLTDFEGKGDGYRYGDEHWEEFSWVPRKGAAVAIPERLKQEMGLFPGAARTPNNSSNFHYMVAGYHQLHCLRVLRDTIYKLNGTYTDDDPFLWDHVLHCVEAVRQGLACNLDPTLIPLDNWWPGIPNGQKHVCRNSDALFKWTSRMGYPLPDFNSPLPHTSPHTDAWLKKQAAERDH